MPAGLDPEYVQDASCAEVVPPASKGYALTNEAQRIFIAPLVVEDINEAWRRSEAQGRIRLVWQQGTVQIYELTP